ncbi:uncharacterized protein LOC116172800 [Photinus pyralis]|uniref:uncharacterized protein LOC116172800 n=1 Tax=Photinus pyralis TaxID=7054 RepID=UPI0012672708|nr:uncharacterized protein LOC116172800 [Photinus pyralis]
MSQKSTENTQQEQNEDVECVYDGDVAGVSELDLEVFSPTSIESTSRSRTPSRGESRTPLTIEGRIGTKRKRHRETGDKERDNKGTCWAWSAGASAVKKTYCFWIIYCG